VNGEDLRARILRFFSDGAIITTEVSLKPGDVVLAYPYLGGQQAMPMVLVGSIVSLLGITGPAYSMQWVRAITQQGFDKLFDLLTGYLGLAPETLPDVPGSFLGSPNVGFDFVTKRFFIPRRRKSTRETTEPRPANSTGTDSETSYSSGPGRPVEPSRPIPRPEEPTSVLPSRPGSGHSGPAWSSGSSPQPPPSTSYSMASTTAELTDVVGRRASTLPPPEAAKEPTPRPTSRVGSAASGETTRVVGKPRHSTEGPTASRLLLREKSRMPANQAVLYSLNDKQDEGTVRALGTSSLFLATGSKVLPAHGMAVIELPIPHQREPTMVRLTCRVELLEDGETLGYEGVDLTIVGIDEGKRPGIFVRYVKSLYYHMTRGRK